MCQKTAAVLHSRETMKVWYIKVSQRHLIFVDKDKSRRKLQNAPETRLFAVGFGNK